MKQIFTKKQITTLLPFICIALVLIFCSCGKSDYVEGDYAVLIGEDDSIVTKVKNVEVLVIDAEYFSEDNISALKANGVKEIYSYLNIGAIENFRPYHEEYESLALGDYENWPEEKWIDVSDERWQSFILDRATELSKKGIDGFFIDNTDVYYLYPENEIYEGLVDILSGIKDLGKKVIVNGGDCFVKKAFESGKENIFDGVNQENVYTTYDFEKKSYGINSQEDREYYTEYLDLVVAKGLKAYSLEYANVNSTSNDAKEYAKDRNYICYVSDNIELKLN